MLAVSSFLDLHIQNGACWLNLNHDLLDAPFYHQLVANFFRFLFGLAVAE